MIKFFLLSRKISYDLMLIKVSIRNTSLYFCVYLNSHKYINKSQNILLIHVLIMATEFVQSVIAQNICPINTHL